MSALLLGVAALFVVTFMVLAVMGTAVGLFLGLCSWLSERF